MNFLLKILFKLTIFCAFISCSHQISKNGRYVKKNNKWVFVDNIKYLKKVSYNIDESFFEHDYLWPIPTTKKISSYFGKRRGRFHDGIDIPVSKGTKIISIADGEVLYSGRMRGYGKIIVIKHNHNGKSFHSVYAHNSSNNVKKGQKINKGQVIGAVGATGRASGPHLHFEIRVNEKAIDPLTFYKSNDSRLAKNN